MFSEFLGSFRVFESFCDLRLETLTTFLTIENNNANNYIVTFEYRVMVTAFAILAMFLQCSPSLPQPSVGQSVDCQTPAPVVESVTHENVKLSGHWPQQQWSSVYWQSWAPVVGVAQR